MDVNFPGSVKEDKPWAKEPLSQKITPTQGHERSHRESGHGEEDLFSFNGLLWNDLGPFKCLSVKHM